ncbi:MAG: hypothetical protein HY372_02430 [Candidatus Andersenbacteria bacterium]|nr:hypothetical protein [Candidatus Andersenbacteria bacterium]
MKIRNPARAAELYAIWEDRDLTEAEGQELDDLVAGCVPVSDEQVEAAAARGWAKICEKGGHS